MKHQPHWYFIYLWCCVLCGKTEETRERRYTPRPDDYNQRHEFSEGACGDHFC
jgi:hypothetical protein